MLAAGLGRRFGGPKLAALLDGRPLVAHVLDTVRAEVDAGRLGQVAVVSGGGPRAGADAAVVERLAAERGFEIVANDSPETGLARSVRLGLGVLELGEAPGAVVLLADQPLTRPEVIAALVAAFRAGGGPLLVPLYRDAGNVPGNPVLLGREIWPLARDLDGDRGMSAIAHRRPDLVAYVEVDGSNVDVDRPADLARLLQQPGEHRR